MAEKVDKTAPVLPLSMKGEKKKKKQARSSVLDDLLPTVRDIVLWTLFHAGNITFSFAFSAAYCMLIDSIFSHPSLAAHAPSWLLPRAVEMTDAEETEALALMAGMLWCAAPQATAGVLALTLPSHRHRRRLRLLLAYAALVATFAGHYMFIVVHGMFVAADPGDLFFRAIGTVAIVALGMDLFCFLVLVLRGREE